MPLPPLHVHDTGEGPVLLFLHAFPLDASMWDHQVAAFSGRYRCLRPDVYGFGASPPPPTGMTLDDVAAAVVDALDSRGVETATVVGQSMGGYIAFPLMRRLASRVERLVLADTRASADTEQARADRLRMAEQVRTANSVAAIVEPMTARLLSPESAAEFHISDPVRGRIGRATPAGVAAAQEAMAARPDSSDLLPAISVPVLVLVGAQDAIVSPAEAERMAAAIPGARFQVVEGAGHLTSLERWEAFNAALAAFLD
ncbi:MAG TPA: alpha/beta fold hydrolase [Candidatus Angelobacter sp.]|nr:alpha/beta fold hydrolase [Candidatus Angelobacter sp.]